MAFRAVPVTTLDTNRTFCEDTLTLARSAFEVEDFACAIALAESAEASQLAVDQIACRQAAAVLLTEGHWAMGQFVPTFVCAMRAAALSEQTGQFDAQVRVLGLGAMAACSAGLPDEGLPLALQATQCARDRDLFKPLALGLMTLANVHANLGDFDEAERLHMQALSRARESGEDELLVRSFSLALLSGILCLEEAPVESFGEVTSARVMRLLTLAYQARRYLGETQLPSMHRSTLHLNIGHVLMLGGKYDEAGILFRQATALVPDQGASQLRWSIEHSVCELERRCGRLERAWLLLQTLLERMPKHESLFTHEHILRTALPLARALNFDEEAARFAEQLQTITKEQERLRFLSRVELRHAKQQTIGALAR